MQNIHVYNRISIRKQSDGAVQKTLRSRVWSDAKANFFHITLTGNKEGKHYPNSGGFTWFIDHFYNRFDTGSGNSTKSSKGPSERWLSLIWVWHRVGSMWFSWDTSLKMLQKCGRWPSVLNVLNIVRVKVFSRTWKNRDFFPFPWWLVMTVHMVETWEMSKHLCW